MDNKKESLLNALDALDIQLDRVIKLSELMPEPGDRADIDLLISRIIDLTKELEKI